MKNDTKVDLTELLKVKDNKIKKGALGKGISALLSDADSSFVRKEDIDFQKVVKIKISDCRPSRYQARKAFNQEEIEALSVSIKEKGVLQPILVRDLGGVYEIIAGERRYRATSLIGFDEIPAIILDVSDKDVMEIGLIENLQRRDLNAIEEANAYKKLQDVFGYTHDSIGKIVGKSRSYISNYLRILSLPNEVLSLIESDKISAGHAKVLVGIPNPMEVANKIINDSLNVRDTEKLSQDVKGNNEKKLKEIIVDREALSIIKILKESNKGLDFTLKSKDINQGELKIKYRSLAELKKLFKL